MSLSREDKKIFGRMIDYGVDGNRILIKYENIEAVV